MNEKQLYTLTDIAQKLGVNYKTLYNYKDVFKEFLVVQDQGRQTRYLPINIEIFNKILELKSDGVANEDVYSLLDDWRRQHPEHYTRDAPSFSPSVFPSVGPSFLPSFSRSFGLSFLPSFDLSVFPSVLLDVLPSGFPSFSPSFLLSGTDTPTVGMEETENKARPCQPTVAENPKGGNKLESQDLENFENRLRDEIGQSLAHLESRLLSQISGIIPQINSALTQYYKVAIELQARIKKLESDLGAGGEHFMGTELDLEKIQVKMEHVDFDDADNAGNAEHNARDAVPKRKRIRTFKDPKDYSDSPDLDLVKKSIHEGKPEKEAITVWIQAMQAKHPELTFADMVRILDSAGVPTLTARKGWNRGTLRSFVQDSS
ncbi:MerR family transcriptional regulator [Desulfonatronum parangueonense]